jgi:dimeric dUTPase (all-alpha-NTP-PPase superfamily)
MDKLDTIFSLQKMLDSDIIKNRGLEGIPQDVWIQKKTLAMISELAELIDEVNFKWWKNKKDINQANVKEELVDILHFFVSMCLTADMTAEELYNIYITKNQENFDRQYGKSLKKGYDIKENQK